MNKLFSQRLEGSWFEADQLVLGGFTSQVTQLRLVEVPLEMPVLQWFRAVSSEIIYLRSASVFVPNAM